MRASLGHQAAILASEDGPAMIAHARLPLLTLNLELVIPRCLVELQPPARNLRNRVGRTAHKLLVVRDDEDRACGLTFMTSRSPSC